MKPTLSAKIETLKHPAWLLEYYAGGGLTESNWIKYAAKNASAKADLAKTGYARFNFDHLGQCDRRIR